MKTNSEIVLTCISEAHVWEFEGEQWREEREDSQEYYGGWAVLSEGADTGFGKQQAQEGWEVEKKKRRGKSLRGGIKGNRIGSTTLVDIRS